MKTKKIDFKETVIPDEFWATVERYLHFGAKSKDDQGHSREVRFRTKPTFMDFLSSLQSKMPEGWIPSTAGLYRHLMHVGAYVTAEYLKKEHPDLFDEELQELHELHIKSTNLEKLLRIKEMKVRMGTISNRIGNVQEGKLVPLIHAVANTLGKRQKAVEDKIEEGKI